MTPGYILKVTGHTFPVTTVFFNRSSSGCSKDIKVTIQSSQTLKLENERILCQINEIAYGTDQKPNNVADWDDRVQTVNWVDVEHNGRVTKRKVEILFMCV